jgi:hypothetical protein
MLESRLRADRWFFGLAGLWFVALIHALTRFVVW